MSIRSWVVCAIVLIAVSFRAASAQSPKSPETFWMFPENTVAYWAFDGTTLGEGDARTRALAAAGLRGLVGSVTSIEGASSVAGQMLQSEVLGAAAHRVCLLELEGEPVEPKGKRPGTERMLRPVKFAAVIEIRAAARDGGHDRFFAAIEAGLTRDSRGDGGPRNRKDLTLPGGLKGYISTSGDSWRDVAWVSSSEAFIVGFGREALQKWMPAGKARPRTGAWQEHRTAVNKKRERGALVCEVFADLNALRRGVPDEFASGRMGRLVHAWHIANDRTFMAHGVLTRGREQEKGEKAGDEAGTPLLAIDVSSSSRAEPPGKYKTVSITESEWPKDLPGRPEAEPWAVLMRAGAPSWIDIGMETYEALGGPGFDAVRSRWERRVAPMLERIVPRIGEWVVVRPGPELTITLRPASGPDRFTADLRAVFSTLAPTVATSGKAWSLEVPEAEEGLRGLMWRVREDGAAIETKWQSPKSK